MIQKFNLITVFGLCSSGNLIQYNTFKKLNLPFHIKTALEIKMAELDMSNNVVEEERIENNGNLMKNGEVEQEEFQTPSLDNNMDLAAFEDKYISDTQKENDDNQDDSTQSGGNLIDIGDLGGTCITEEVGGGTEDSKNADENIADTLVNIGNTNGVTAVDDLLGGGEIVGNSESEPVQTDDLLEVKSSERHEEIESDSGLTESADAMENGVQETAAAPPQEEEISDETKEASEKVLVDVFDSATLNQAEEAEPTEPEPEVKELELEPEVEPETKEPEPEVKDLKPEVNEEDAARSEDVPTDVTDKETCHGDGDVRKGPAVQAAVKAREEASKKAAAGGPTKSSQMFIPSMFFHLILVR